MHQCKVVLGEEQGLKLEQVYDVSEQWEALKLEEVKSDLLSSIILTSIENKRSRH